MSDTINNGIPFVPENTIDPAAGLNLSLNTIDALLQVLVQSVGENTPPAGVEGQRFIVGTAPTGTWMGQANKLARFLDGFWQFFDARYVVNAADGALYVRSGSVWTLFAPPIADNSVTNAKLADVAAQTIKGRTTAGTGDPEDLTAAQARGVLGLATTDSPTFTALTLTNGHIVFPATQVPSANANTLDGYEEGTWTPVLTFATPGDLSVVYSIREGTYTKIGRVVQLTCRAITSTFTHTTAAGVMRVSGAPLSGASVDYGPLHYQNVTKAGYTSHAVRIQGGTVVDTLSSGSGVTTGQISAADMPSGGSTRIEFTIIYHTS